MYAAIPIRWDSEVLGAVLVSQSTLGILAMLDEVRLDILRVVLASLLVAAVLSVLVSMTIARPLSRLGAEAMQIGGDAGSVLVAVCDEGPGIPGEHRTRVFERFFSFRPGTANGTGHVSACRLRERSSGITAGTWW